MTLTRQFRVNEVRFAEPDAQLDADVILKNCGGKTVLRPLRAMHLPQVAYVLEPWLWLRSGRTEAN